MYGSEFEAGTTQTSVDTGQLETDMDQKPAVRNQNRFADDKQYYGPIIILDKRTYPNKDGQTRLGATYVGCLA